MISLIEDEMIVESDAGLWAIFIVESLQLVGISYLVWRSIAVGKKVSEGVHQLRSALERNRDAIEHQREHRRQHERERRDEIRGVMGGPI